MYSTHFNGMSLDGGYEDTISSIAFTPQGELVIELVDCADEFITGSGSDHTYRVTIDRIEKERLYQMLLPQIQQRYIDPSVDPDQLLLWLLKTQFSDFYAIYAWLQKNDIRFCEALDRSG